MQMANPALEERHWRQVFEAIEQPYDAAADVSVAALLEHGVLAKLESVQAIAATATKEFSMLKILDAMDKARLCAQCHLACYRVIGRAGLKVHLSNTFQMQPCTWLARGHAWMVWSARNAVSQSGEMQGWLGVQEWQGLDVRLVAYKDTGTSIVSGTDDIQTILDDQIVKAQAMNASPFVKPFAARCAAHEATLQTLQDLLDAWLACQATWLYLEPIFSSDDIVKQMPEEGEKFQTVDATWRDVMAAVAAEPAVLPLGRDAGTLERLRECNGLLDEIQKGLAAYLEKKRLFFPRCVSLLGGGLGSVSAC